VVASTSRARAQGPPIYDDGWRIVRVPARETIDLTPAPAALARLGIEFVRPTAIKHDGVVLRRPSFGALVRRIRDRSDAA
jgi:hypothetical protein